jgi:hypothetical protein
MLTDSDRALGHMLAGQWLEQAGETRCRLPPGRPPLYFLMTRSKEDSMSILFRSITVAFNNTLPYDLQREDYDCVNEADCGGGYPPGTIAAGTSASWLHIRVVTDNLSGWARYGFKDNAGNHVSASMSWANPTSGSNTYGSSVDNDQGIYSVQNSLNDNIADDGHGTNAKITFSLRAITDDIAVSGRLLHAGSDKYVVSENASTADHADLILFGGYPSTFNSYALTRNGYLYHKGSGKMVVAENAGTANHTRLILFGQSPASFNTFELRDGFLYHRGSNKYVVVENASTADHAKMILYEGTPSSFNSLGFVP